MNRIILVFLLCFAVFSASVAGLHQHNGNSNLPATAPIHRAELENTHFLPDRIVVKIAADEAAMSGRVSKGREALQSITALFPGSTVAKAFPNHTQPAGSSDIDLSRYHIVRFAGPIDVIGALQTVAGHPGIEFAEPCFIYPIDACAPNDPEQSRQYALAKILADSAWCTSTGDTTVVIGIVDTGIQLDHPDLVANIWINPGEDGPDGLGGSKRSNGIDDDGSGKIDDWRGWDFGGADYNTPVEDNLPAPTASNNAHGTHVAGIASASTNNGLGVAGVAYKCKLLAVKTTSDNDTRNGGTPFVVFGFEGIAYAADMGADVINCSWGGTGGSQFEQDVITYATQRGALVVAAAGNANSTIPDFPAGYDGVISVASTNSSDIKASTSKHGMTIDLAAPGEQIFGTYYSSVYATLSGTSMASPHVAGVAALVKSKNPGFTPLQVGEQVRVTADPIGSLNPNYLLGKGRLNALRALTESSPAIRMTSFELSDFAGGRQNGYPEPGESLAIVTTITNYLSPTSANARITLRTSSAYITISDSVFLPGSIGTLQNVANTLSPFKMRVGLVVPPATTVTMMLVIEDGTYTDVQYFTMLINPTFATHDVNNIRASFVNNGRIGFSDLNNNAGSGFVYRELNHLFEGGIIIGNSSTKLLNVIRNGVCATCQDNDFASPGLYELSMIQPDRQDGRSTFLDSIASPTNQLGLRVRMSSYAYTTPEDSNFVLVQYDLRNTSAVTLTNLFMGLFFDWDVQNYNANKTGFDATRNLGYTWDTTSSNPVYIGTSALEGPVGFRGLSNSASLSVSRAEKYNWISGGVVSPETRGDIHFVISAGPFTIAQGGTQTIAFALLAGNSLAEVQTSADVAKARWDSLKGTVGVPEESDPLPTVMRLDQNYPNPFNPSTVISYTVPTAGNVSLRIYDLLGREVGSVVDMYQPAGSFRTTVDATDLAAGVYFYRLTAGNRSLVRKFIVLK